ncbi:transient receptor potential cation channel subfamily V member 5 isoform X2 [Amia ocellicauda]|uniref:transient receptor potential cation channel subfamily V member 5 isoform X2 n=1 Tax=Amia ocellicauda TaxID=2972642 RepID=UPI0034641322
MVKSNQVCPSGHGNAAFEMREVEPSQVQGQAVGSQFSMASVASTLRAAVKWKGYTSGRRCTHVCVRRQNTGKPVEVTYQGLAEDIDITDGHSRTDFLNKKLLDHFRSLAASNANSDQVDLQFLERVITDGADVNSADRYGQTVLHEISRAWNVDVMRFFVERGADVRRADSYGVTPLHVAAALDYTEMVEYLIQREADIGARTSRDLQTPLHFGAKNDAVRAVRLLLKHGAHIGARDYKERTPLQLAANMDRSEAARTLMELGADVGVQDSDGQLCISAMIGAMPPVAHSALDQFHVQDRMTRQQFYYLNLLEPRKWDMQTQKCKKIEALSPLELIVKQWNLDLITHPVILKLIKVKWNLYGRLGAWILLLLNFLFIVSWTIFAISVSVIRPEESPYIFPQDWWRVLVVVVALLLTVTEVSRELAEMWRSQGKQRRWQAWWERRISDDKHCSHPMWPEERKYLEEQLKAILRIRSGYFQDPWNVFDWLVFLLLMVMFGIHLADIFIQDVTLRVTSLRLFAVSIIFLWLRLMKHVRAFRVFGPFIVMLGSILGDVSRFLFLYAEFFIPYACAFWIIFGGTAAVPSMQTVLGMLYSLYRLTLSDGYEFDEMDSVDPVMARLLCGTFLALSTVLCLNLLIALLSDTFQRVHDQASANAVMQQAAIILQVEDAIPCFRWLYDPEHVHKHCAPLKEFYDDDTPSDKDDDAGMRKVAVDIKETLDNFLESNKNAAIPASENKDTVDVSESAGTTMGAIQEQSECLRAMKDLQTSQSKHNKALKSLKKEVQELRVLLQHLTKSLPGKEPKEPPSSVSSHEKKAWGGSAAATAQRSPGLKETAAAPDPSSGTGEGNVPLEEAERKPPTNKQHD